jgi:DNA repair exonuclease SbcCD ATPase subunit
MIRLRKLSIQGFRGARFDLPLDFTADHRSFSIYGENATGKSTITDALEWFLLGRVDHLWREDCKEEALRHVLLDSSGKCEVQIEFSNTALNGARILPPDLKTKTSNASQDFRTFLEHVKAERIFLRHAQITKFIDETKSKKKEEIAAIIGYQDILGFRDAIQGAYNTLRKDSTYLTARQHAEDAKNKLFQLAGAIIASEKELFDKANALLQPFNVGVIVSDDKSYDQALDALRGKISQPDRAEKRLRLDQLKKDCEELSTSVGTLLSKKDDFLVKYDELVKNKHAVSQLNIEQFLMQGHKVISDGHFHDQQCPFCLTPYDLDELRHKVDERIKGIAKIRGQYDETKALKIEFVNATKSVSAVCERLAKNCEGLDKFTELVTAVEHVGKTLSSLAEGANQCYAKFEPVTISQQTLNDLNGLSTLADQNAKLAQSESDMLQLSDEEKKLIDKIEQVRDLRTYYRQYERNARTVKAYEEQILSLSTIFDTFKTVQNDALQAVLDRISEDVGKFYTALHPKENVDNVRLRVVGEEGIEFEYQFHGKPTHPPMKYLSESHLNSLGVCLFLASAKLFNKNSRFLVLDDIVTSFDLGHRRRLLRLLKEEFKDWQIILLTHERLWFDMIKRELAQDGWLFKDVEWSAENGVQLTKSAADLREFIEEKRKKFDVSNDVRKLLEASLKEICYALEVRVPFRFNDDNEQRMSGELLSDLRATVNRKSPSLKGHAAFSNLEGSNLIATVGSHDNPGETISSGDIDVALADIDALIDLFRCKTCGRYVEAERQVAGQNRITCKCGEKELEWK